MDLFREHHQRLIHSLARYWPEVTELLELGSATLLALLARVGGPRDVARDTTQARKLMLGMSRRLMTEEKVEAVLQCAQASVGLAMLGAGANRAHDPRDRGAPSAQGIQESKSPRRAAQ